MEQVVFNTIKQAITYREHCSLCKNKLHINRGSASDQVMYDHRILKIQDDKTVTTLNIETNRVSVEAVTYNEHNIGTYGHWQRQQSVPYIGLTPGQLIIGISLECYFCHQYCYTTAFHLDTGLGLFCFASLNSEWIEIEDGPSVLGIHNSYATGITKYSQYLASGETKECEIPVIPLNVENPKETLARLKKLIIFT